MFRLITHYASGELINYNNRTNINENPNDNQYSSFHNRDTVNYMTLKNKKAFRFNNTHITLERLITLFILDRLSQHVVN